MKFDLSKKRILIFAAIVLAVVLIVVLAVVAFGGNSEDVNGSVPSSSIPFQDHDEFNQSSEMTSSDKDELEDLWNEAVGNTSGESSSDTSSDASSSNDSSSTDSSSTTSNTDSSTDSSDSESSEDSSANAVIDGSRPGYIG